MLRCSWYLACLVSAICLGVLGCGGSVGGPKPVKVKGTVTLDGQPLPDATVTFLPTNKDEGKQATGMTNSQGSFELTTYSTADGAIPGEYSVVVDYKESVDLSGEGGGQPDLKKMFLKFEKNIAEKKKSKPKIVVPKKYSNTSKPYFKQRVPADGPVNLVLESK
jgi:hypothetical protein